MMSLLSIQDTAVLTNANLSSTGKTLINIFLKLSLFLAPTGAHEVALWVCWSVIYLNSSLILHAIFLQFSCKIYAFSQQSVSSQLALS